MPDLNLVLKKLIFLKKSKTKHISLIYLDFQNDGILTCMGIA